MTDFFSPYGQFLLGAAYSINQSLEALGITSSEFIEKDATGRLVSSYWSASESVIPIFGIMFVVTGVVSILWLASGYTLGRWKGLLLATLCAVAPGAFSSLGWWPDINYLPSRYVIGSAGTLGSQYGISALMILGVTLGWTLVVLATDSFMLKDNFRHRYDHVWYLSAVAAAIFFVSESGSTENLKILEHAAASARASSSYLSRQAKDYEEHCQENNIQSRLSCEWASEVQQILLEFSAYDWRLFRALGPEASEDLYNLRREDAAGSNILEIRREIETYNRIVCPVTMLDENRRMFAKPSGLCLQTPSLYCQTFPDPPEGFIDPFIVGRTVALSSECVVPTLVQLHKTMLKVANNYERQILEKHYRFFFFLFLSIVAGGKIGNATTKLSWYQTRADVDKRRIGRFFWNLSASLVKLVNKTLRVTKGRTMHFISSVKERFGRFFKQPS